VANPLEDLWENIRWAQGDIKDAGFSPNLVAIGSADARGLDLTRTGGSAPGDGPFLLPPSPRETGITRSGGCASSWRVS
jgi:hypothetical protein